MRFLEIERDAAKRRPSLDITFWRSRAWPAGSGRAGGGRFSDSREVDRVRQSIDRFGVRLAEPRGGILESDFNSLIEHRHWAPPCVAPHAGHHTLREKFDQLVLDLIRLRLILQSLRQSGHEVQSLIGGAQQNCPARQNCLVVD